MSCSCSFSVLHVLSCIYYERGGDFLLIGDPLCKVGDVALPLPLICCCGNLGVTGDFPFQLPLPLLLRPSCCTDLVDVGDVGDRPVPWSALGVVLAPLSKLTL